MTCKFIVEIKSIVKEIEKGKYKYGESEQTAKY